MTLISINYQYGQSGQIGNEGGAASVETVAQATRSKWEPEQCRIRTVPSSNTPAGALPEGRWVCMIVVREIIGAELRRRRQDQGRTLR